MQYKNAQWIMIEGEEKDRGTKTNAVIVFDQQRFVK